MSNVRLQITLPRAADVELTRLAKVADMTKSDVLFTALYALIESIKTGVDPFAERRRNNQLGEES